MKTNRLLPGFLISVTILLGGRSLANARSDKARPVATAFQITNLSTALNTFKVDCHRYPTTAEGLQALLVCPNPSELTNWHGPYVSEVPKDPWGSQYIYQQPGSHNTNHFDLYSTGADYSTVSFGNDRDDINNWDRRSSWQDYYFGNRYWRAFKSFFVDRWPIAFIGAIVAYVLVRNWGVKHYNSRSS